MRSAWCLESGTWRLRLMEIVTGSRPQNWQDRTWKYSNVWFSADNLPGRLVGSWLTEGKIILEDREHDLGNPENRLNWERRESHAQSGYEALTWPTYEVQLGSLQTNEPQRPLLSDDGAPSFASFHNAAACFFVLGATPPGGSVPSALFYRDLDRRARINSVGITEDELRVEVEGEAVDGLIVELAGDEPGIAETIKTTDRIATIIFRLDDGLRPGAWVVVRSGSEWLDRRFLAWPWARGQEPGVTINMPAKTKLDAFIAGRESDTVEFKQTIPDAETTKAKVMKTVCAFANGAGGSILFGITDDYDVVGLPAAKASHYIDTLSELVDAWVEPTPSYGFEILPIDGTESVVIELAVSAGHTLFGSSKPNETRRVYVRHHSRSVPARLREIETLVRNQGVAGHYPGLPT